MSSPGCPTHDPSNSTCLENGFAAATPTTTTTTCSKQPSTSNQASDDSREAAGSSAGNGRGRKKCYTEEGKRARRKSGGICGYTLETTTGSPPLKHASSAPYSLMCEDDEGLYHRPALVGGSVISLVLIV